MDRKDQPHPGGFAAPHAPTLAELPHAQLNALWLSEITSQTELQSQAKFDEMMFGLSKTFIGLPVDRVDGELNNGLKALADVLDLDRVSINLLDSDKKNRTITHSWAGPGIPRAPVGKITELLPWEASLIAKRETYCVSTPEDLPAEAAADRTFMLSEGLRSWLTIPLQVGGEQFGEMGADMFRRQQRWNALLVSRFQQAAEIFANAISRERMIQKLYESAEHTNLALDSAKLGVWSWTIGRGELWASEKTWELFGWPANSKLAYPAFLNPIHPEDRENVQRQLEQATREPADYHAEFRVLLPDGSVRWIRNLGRSYAGAKGAPERIIGVSFDITAPKSNEQALIEQLKFEKLLAELSATLINLPASQVHSRIEEAQRCICEVLELDHSTLAMVSPERDKFVIEHVWAREGFELTVPIFSRDLPWIVQTVLAGQRVSFKHVDDLPKEAARDKETLRLLGQKSNASFPLSAGGKVIGAVAFGSLREEREWPPSLVERLGLMAQVFANAVARARADETLHRAYCEIEELKGRLENENVYLREEVKLEHHHREVIGDSESTRRVLKKVEQVAPTDSTVLVLGETGTGKELIARTIHEHSRRKDRVMVKVNCAALPSSLIESELFGREKGAFTGALTREIGRFELANHSTILLDEIGELPVELQSKLLRVLQEGELERLGSPKTIKVDVRVIAATSRDLRQAIHEGKFREDLFYRLNVFPIMIPPLRERRDDIPPLVWHFVNELSQRMGRSIETIHGTTMAAFKSYYWPGNVRELSNMIERFLITSTDTVFRARLPNVEAALAIGHTQTFEEVERHHILHIMELVGWRVRGGGGAAQLLGLKPTTLESRMQKLGIVRGK